MERDLYDVSQYTDLELLNILDTNPNPTDRELEAKIFFLIHKYQNMQNASGDQLAKFFNDIHRRFFDVPEEEDETETEEVLQEGFTDLNIQYAHAKEQYQTDKPAQTMIPISTPISDGDLSKDTAQPNQLDIDLKDLNKDIKQLGVQIGKANDTNKSGASDQLFVNTLSYAKDNLNPLLQQTIKRIISIDSQYRDNKLQISTDFTFNISENLKDVVSLKLYSIQIPFTWYTISNRYGCNFFLLEGKSPGINRDEFSFKFDISAGNYTSADKVAAAVNVKIGKVITANPDISFGTTNVSYNSDTMVAALAIDITQVYRESSYYLYFPYWTTPNDLLDASGLQGPRYQSIPGFLGYNYTNYKCFTVNSVTTLPPTIDAGSVSDDTLNRSYYVDDINNTNNYFTIISYYGPKEYSSDTSIIDNSYQIKLTLSGLSSRNDILTDLSNQIANARFLQESFITRTNITNQQVLNNGNSYFQMQIKLNRQTTSNFKNLKTVLQFPTETRMNGYNNIWTGYTSCFRFLNTSYELSDIVSETTPIAQQTDTYQVSALSVYLKCVKPNFNLSINDYQMTVKPNVRAGYTLLEFLNEMNSEIIYANELTKNTRNTQGDFYLPYSHCFIDAKDYFIMEMDITKIFYQDMYQLDLSNSFLTNIMNLEPYYTDLSTNNVFSSSFDLNAIYTFDSSFILSVRPQGNYGNHNEKHYTIPAPEITTFFSYTDLENAINNSFNNAVDSDGKRTLTGTNVSLNYNLLTRKIDCSFTVVIQKTLTQNDYSIQFFDPSNSLSQDGNNTIVLATNSWYKYFFINPNQILYPYDLSNVAVQGTPYSKIIATTPILVPQITLIDGFNNFFYLKPYSPGVYDRQGYNDILFTIPANIAYSRDSLVAAINVALSSNSLTTGSSLSIIKQNNVDYSKIRLNVNKIYTAADYSVVFYDPFSFSSCDPVSRSIKNTTWDTTLGWLLGFRNYTIYGLSDFASSTNSVVTIRSDTTISLNLYNYFLVCLDDYTQSHLNDGLITLAAADTDVHMPSYVNKANYQCDPVTGQVTYNTAVTTDGNSLTQKQLYALNAIANNQKAHVVMPGQKSTSKSLGPGPYVTDVFGFVPMKTTGLATGAVYVDYGGSLQQQERIYFGPVNIQRMGVRLLSDRGDPVDLNGANWSFSLIVEQLYQQKPTTDKDGGKKK
jgi:hypothetical protein